MVFRSILRSSFVLVIIIIVNLLFISSVKSTNITTNSVEAVKPIEPIKLIEQNTTTQSPNYLTNIKKPIESIEQNTTTESPNHLTDINKPIDSIEQNTTTQSPDHLTNIIKKPFEFRDIVASYKFYFRGFNGSWISDTEFWYLNDFTFDLTIYNAEKKSHTVLIDGLILDKWGSYSALKFTKDNSKVLITYDEKSLFRFSTLARYVVFDVKTEKEIDIGNKELLNLCMWSKNYKDIIYVKNNDVYVLKNLTTEIQLTNSGIKNTIFNGIPDWVYEEEVLKQKEAIWLSPDGNKLAVATFNDTLVNKFTYFYYSDKYPTSVALRYPKPGRINPNVKLQYMVFDKTIKWYTINPPTGVTEDHILRSAVWINNDKIGTFWMNRRQNLSIFQVCDHSMGKCDQPFEINEPNGWVDTSQMMCTQNIPMTQCYFIAFVKNWRNIINFNVTSGKISAAYPAAHTVLKVYGLKEDDKTKNVDIFYAATTVTHHNHQQVYKNGECLTCNLQGPEGINCTYASAKFSKQFSYYTVTCSGPTPKYSKIFRTSDNKEIFYWNDNLATRKLLNEYQSIKIMNLNVPVTDDGLLKAAVKLYLPNEIDLNDNNTTPNKTYPMILDVYGGPNSVRVNDEFSVAFKDYLITNYNVIYCKIDGRGSGNKGKKLLYTINNGIGTVEVQDELTVTKYLHDKYKFIDANRTAIWGWSYGGFVTAMALGMDDQKLFKCGISVAPVTNWLYYDSIYTERFMGLPQTNWAAYNKTDITKHLTNLSKHKFLLMHGLADDNVHFSQSMILTKVLIKKDIDFDQMFYTNEGHSMLSVHNHIYHTMEGFWKKCLILQKVNYTSPANNN